jgi:hypothetical protein
MTTTTKPEPGWARQRGHAQVKPQRPDDDVAHGADRLMIAERLARYGWGYDERDRDLLADCFTADGTWEGSIMGGEVVGPVAGRVAVVEFLMSFWDVQSDQRRHVFTNVVVDDLAADGATAHAYLVLTASADGVMRPVTNGPYRFRLRKESGTWRIAELVAGFDAPF